MSTHKYHKVAIIRDVPVGPYLLTNSRPSPCPATPEAAAILEGCICFLIFSFQQFKEIYILI